MRDNADVFLIDILRRMSAAGSWCGETHLQKSVYLLQELEQVDAPAFDFIMYKHGPYSFDLHDAVGEMEASLLIERQATPPYGSQLGLTPSGKKLLSSSEISKSIDSEVVDSIVRAFSVLSVSQLERYATACYVNLELNKSDRQMRVRRFMELKPHIPEPLVDDSFNKVEEYSKSKQGKSL